MKRVINNKIEKEFIIEVILTETQDVAAATYRGFSVPDGPVIDGTKGVVLSAQVIADYEAFIVSIEDLCTEYYGLKIIYQNASEDYSHYYSFLATDDEGNVKLKFRLRLRVSNHPAHRSKLSQKHKKEETQSPEYKKYVVGKPPQPLFRQILVNNQEYSNYVQAFADICNILDECMETLSK